METAKVKFNPNLWVCALKLGAIYVQRGINNFDDWSRKMTEAVGEEIEPWESAVWETLCAIPEGSKFDDKVIVVIAQAIGSLREEKKANSQEDIKKIFVQRYGEKAVEQIMPMIQISYKGIDRFFADLERNQPPQTVVEQLRWEVEDKTLTVGGVREIKCYSYDDSPWIDSLNVIQKIVIEDGVEEIAANAFIECTRLEQVIIPASVKTIGDCAFTVCYCGARMVNNCRNVIWSLDNGVLMIKKNPAAKSDADFSTGYAKWQVAEKNIVSVKIERGVVPGKQFFDWLSRMGNNLQVSF